MRKIYVLDTSALIFDPCAWKSFPNSEILIPLVVLSELDKLKKQSGDAGRNARVCIRLLDEICNKGDIATGILVETDTIVKVDVTHYDLTKPEFAGFGDPTYGDTQILACAYYTHKNNLSGDVILISNDINLRVKSQAHGVPAIAHEGAGDALSDLYSGNSVIADELAGLDLLKLGTIDPEIYGFNLNLHECVAFEGDDGKCFATGRLVAPNKLKLIRKIYPWNVSSRNNEQTFAIDLMMDKSVDLVTMTGKAGCGKSLIALATALELVLGRKEYERLIIYRPIQAVGSDIGYIPGDISEKLAPWFQAIMDNFEVLFSSKAGSDWKRDFEMYQKKGKIEMEAITYIRGRSIPNAIILIDESQNITKEDMKTILTRAGENTKIVLTGDLDQIDNRDLDSTNNGLTHVIEMFKESHLSGHVTFTKGERSRLATTAADIL